MALQVKRRGGSGETLRSRVEVRRVANPVMAPNAPERFTFDSSGGLRARLADGRTIQVARGRPIARCDALVLAEIHGENGADGGNGHASHRFRANGVWASGGSQPDYRAPTACMD